MSFDNGRNGNPPARPHGWREPPTLREEDLEAILRKVVERAKQGNLAAARLCLDLLGRRRRSEWNCPSPLVPHETPFNFTSVMRDIREKVAAGELTLAQGARLATEMRPYLRLVNAVNRMVRRLKTVEEAAGGAPRRAFKDLH
jgi:hypothetical protein